MHRVRRLDIFNKERSEIGLYERLEYIEYEKHGKDYFILDGILWILEDFTLA